jgi:hypothetical protein
VVFLQFGWNIYLFKIFLKFYFGSLIFNIFSFYGIYKSNKKIIIKLLSTNYQANCENDYHYLRVVCILRLGTTAFGSSWYPIISMKPWEKSMG